MRFPSAQALLRRAAARLELKDMEGALADAQQGLAADPSIKELLRVRDAAEKALVRSLNPPQSSGSGSPG